MNDKEFAPLNATCVRNLNDKLYEKRKVGALEVERMVKEYVLTGQKAQIKKILKVLGDEFALSHNPNARKGGVIGLAATAIALGKESYNYVNELVHPVLASFHDSDSRVRYYACEALYNIVKVARGHVLPYFNEIFDGLSKLSADTDQNVKNGMELLDRLIKDIVTESSSFDLKAFIPLLRERVYTQNPFSRQFIVSWVAVLDAVPDINMLVLLPEILDGLFQILGDSNLEIRKMCQGVLDEFLNGIKKCKTGVKFEAMANILILHSQSHDELIQYTAITWLCEFIKQADRPMLQYASGIINAILPNLSIDFPPKKNVSEAAKSLNAALMDLVCESDDLPTPTLGSPDPDHITIEEGVQQSLRNSEREVFTFRHVGKFFPVLLATLSDQSEEVVLLDLEALAEISSNPAGHWSTNAEEVQKSPDDHSESDLVSGNQLKHGLNKYFTKFMISLVDLFKKNAQLLEERGSFIIRQLSQLLNAEDVFQTLSQILEDDDDMLFACSMIQTINTILLTSTELFELRNQLKELKTQESCSLFTCLYKSWCHSPVATVSLCYLTQNYSHACQLMQTFGDLEVTVDFLKEIDKLVQLIESPIFAYLRLQLLDVENNQDLIKSLYGLLMLLPQSEAFKNLRSRLDCVPHYQLATLHDK
ncbi:hypothetical protein KUTeg_019905 [Tegillarca granosa]|uniref:Protein VAC14 homolog n=1 Tax=Tegillarca granosa TaxID=220873 RepID=A0ABQ9EFU9_TEGGR|nr:hypothetical protein KUTeg_019905 [Tegillarca granosa]